MTAAGALPSELVKALESLAATPQLLVALDFDGTLAPLVDDPEEARALPESRKQVLRLAEMTNTSVALVSGRAMDSLLHVAEPSDAMLLSGSHGVEARLDSAPRVTLSDAEREQIATLRSILDRVAGGDDALWVEVKPAGFALHSRLASPDVAALAQGQALEQTAAAVPGLTVRPGSNVLEFSVRSTSKGDAVTMLREYTDATAVFFAGDDVTDEDGFAVLRANDLGLKCGNAETAAAFSVPDLASVGSVLRVLADLRG